MKKLIAIITIAIISIATTAIAKDTIIDVPIKQVYQKIDKNGEPYARIIVSEQRQLNGIEYPASVLVMAFSDVVEETKNLQVGENLKAVVSESLYKGKKNYQLIHVIE